MHALNTLPSTANDGFTKLAADAGTLFHSGTEPVPAEADQVEATERTGVVSLALPALPRIPSRKFYRQ